MAREKTVIFRCDFCGAEGQGMFRNTEYHGHEAVLPKGWVEGSSVDEFCSQLCYDQFELIKLKDRAKKLEEEIEAKQKEKT